MGCLILAGGQGTRLGWHGPKGCMPLPLPGKPTLFEHLLNKVARKGKELPVAIMTSPLNRKETEDYLEKKNYFGLKQVALFNQKTHPISDQRGYLVYQKKGKVAVAPAGNGAAFLSFCRSGLANLWQRLGVDVVQVLFIDNWLGCPFDEELVGVHEERAAQLVVRCVRRDHPGEQVGVVGMERGRLAIKEYTELSPSLEISSEENNLFPLAYTGIFSCTMQWLNEVASRPLPYHLAYKKGVGSVLVGNQWEEVERVVKFETFLFDLFPEARSFAVVLSERNRHFFPLKNLADVKQLDGKVSRSTTPTF